MPKSSHNHPYSDRKAFERLMLLIATFLQNPGIGSADTYATTSDLPHDALALVKLQLEKLAQQNGIEVSCSIPTIRKDLVTLRNYGILDKRMYRWGYYLGTGALTKQEFSVALNALASLAEYQRSPNVMRMYEALVKRLQGFESEGDSKLLYPVRSQINRSIVLTDLEDMALKKQYRHTLFHCLDTVESAILEGQVIEIFLHSDPYSDRTGTLQVYPLQILYHDIAWYLLYENSSDGHFVVSRVDRFLDRCQKILNQSRSIEEQKQSLGIAHKLIEQGWGLHLGDLEEQMLERNGQLKFEIAKVRFFAPVIPFIEEGQKRHQSQKIDTKGKPHYIEYQVNLPSRSLNEFSRWVSRFIDNALVLSPQSMVEKHQQASQHLANLYQFNQ
jgi:predicted DNA-binding transcriptional regulator YafY